VSTKSEARVEAQKTLDAAWANEGYPVDPVAIARRLGVKVFTAQIPDEVSGMLRKEPNQAPEIYLDTDDPHVRQRFTCAHEIGHYVRHARADDGSIAFVDYRGPRARTGTDPDEVFANEFAAALLMPVAEVKRLFTLGMRELEMSQWFRVSVETAKWRLVNLGLINV
jgi:Zn-dependent peptidase ImmA (M78 family)